MGFLSAARETRAEATGEGVGTTMRHVLRMSIVFLALLSHSPLAVAQQPTAEQPGISRNEASTTLAQTDSVNDTGVATTFVQNYTARPITLLKNRLSGNVIPLNTVQPSQEDKTAP